MSNEEQCFVLLILQVINFFSFNKCFSKALKGFFPTSVLPISSYPDLKCSWVIYERLSCVSAYFIEIY